MKTKEEAKKIISDRIFYEYDAKYQHVVGGPHYMAWEDVPELAANIPAELRRFEELRQEEYEKICELFIWNVKTGSMPAISKLRKMKIKGAARTLWTPDGKHFYNLKYIINALNIIGVNRRKVSYNICYDENRTPLILSVHGKECYSEAGAMILPVVNTAAQNVAAGAVIAA